MEQGLFLGKKKFRVAELSCLGKIFYHGSFTL